MANAAVTFDGTRVNDAEALGTVWTDLGGGKAASEPDFVYQNTAAVSEKVGTTEGGVALDMVATVDYSTTTRVIIFKLIATNSTALNNKGSTGGILEVGSGGRRSAYARWYVVGGDTYPIVGGWLIYPLDPNTTPSATPGTAPTLTAIDYYGFACDFSATSKAENVALDAVDYIDLGSGLTLVGGDGAFTDGDFDLFVSTDEGTAANRWGIVSTREGVLFVTGVLTIGTATETDFIDTGKVIVWPDAEFIGETGFFGLNIGLQHASSVIDISNCVFTSRGTSGGAADTRAELNVTGTSGSLTLTACRFANMRVIVLTSGCLLTAGCDIEADSITQGSAEIEGSKIRTTSATSVAAITDPTFGTTTGIHDSELIQAGAGHAVELSGVGATVTITNVTWTGYGATGNDDAAIDVTAASGTTTINWSGGTAPTYKTAGATVVVQNVITVTFTCENGSEVRVYTAGTSTEIDGVESSTGGGFAASLQAATSYDVVIIREGSVPIRRESQQFAATVTVDYNQQNDPNFVNAA